MARLRSFLAAGLSSHIDSSLERNQRIRRRIVSSELPSDSPGRLYTYISAGGLELPDDEKERRRYVARSPRLAIVLALLLLVIYFCF